MGADGTLLKGSMLETLLKEGANFDGMSEIQKEGWWNDISTTLA
jgi:hypothetical protein